MDVVALAGGQISRRPNASLVHVQLNAFFDYGEFHGMRTYTGDLNMNQIHPTRYGQILIRRQIP